MQIWLHVSGSAHSSMSANRGTEALGHMLSSNVPFFPLEKQNTKLSFSLIPDNNHLHRFACLSSGCIQWDRSNWNQASDRCSNVSSRRCWSGIHYDLWIHRHRWSRVRGRHFPQHGSTAQWQQLLIKTHKLCRRVSRGYLAQFFPGFDVVYIFFFPYYWLQAQIWTHLHISIQI